MLKKTVVGSIVLFTIACTRNEPQKYVDAPTFILEVSDDIAAPNQLCPNDMIEVVGDYCPEVEEVCLKWLDTDTSPTANGGIGPMRCAEFKNPTKCLSKKRIPLHFCIDKFEYPNQEGTFPIIGMDYHEAKKLALKENKRLCTVNEWNFACEGPDSNPYAYGYMRDDKACNIDKPWLDYTKYSRDKWGEIYQGVKSDSNSKCKSVFGVINMNGNVDEILDSENNENVILSGGYWGPVRTRCRPKTTSHSKFFSFYQLGVRFCSDLKTN